MTLHATARPQQLSTTGAVFRVVVTLLMFLVVFITFLIVPLIALGLGFLVYLVWRSRGTRAKAGGGDPSRPGRSATGFGAGV